MDNFEFLGPNLHKIRFCGQNFKNVSLDSELASLRSYVHQLSDKTGTFKFLGPNLPKNWILGLKFQKSKSGFGISILEILCVPIFRQNGEIWIFELKFAQK